MNTTETLRFQADMLQQEAALERIRQAHIILDRMHAIISDTLQP